MGGCHTLPSPASVEAATRSRWGQTHTQGGRRAHLCLRGPSRNLRHLRQILEEDLRGRWGEGVGVPSWKVHVLRAASGASWAAGGGYWWATAVIHAHQTDTITDNMTTPTAASPPTPPTHCS